MTGGASQIGGREKPSQENKIPRGSPTKKKFNVTESFKAQVDKQN